MRTPHFEAYKVLCETLIIILRGMNEKKKKHTKSEMNERKAKGKMRPTKKNKNETKELLENKHNNKRRRNTIMGR